MAFCLEASAVNAHYQAKWTNSLTHYEAAA